MNARVAPRLFRGQVRLDAIDPLDRGLAYGDGLFETMRVHAGEVPWWPAHRRRLQQGATRLRIELPEMAWLEGEIRAITAGTEAAVLKLLLSRGSGGRGYALPATASPLLVLSLHALPAPARDAGLRLRWCETRLATQPLLAGLKHCNRLEQVLARAEWTSDEFDEGLMCDAQGQVVCATAANVFALIDGDWCTPPVEHCGVRGVLREWLLAEVHGARVAALAPADVEACEALVLGNAVRGILAVSQLGERRWQASPQVEQLRQRLALAAPMFAALPPVRSL